MEKKLPTVIVNSNKKPRIFQKKKKKKAKLRYSKKYYTV